MPKTYIYDGSKRDIKKIFVYDGTKREIKKVYAYDPTKRLVFSGGITFSMTAGSGSTTRGYEAGTYGSVSPSPVTVGPGSVRRLTSNTLSDAFIFELTGFTTNLGSTYLSQLKSPFFGTLNANAATFTYTNPVMKWQWSVTPDFVSGTTYPDIEVVLT